MKIGMHIIIELVQQFLTKQFSKYEQDLLNNPTEKKMSCVFCPGIYGFMTVELSI